MSDTRESEIRNIREQMAWFGCELSDVSDDDIAAGAAVIAQSGFTTAEAVEAVRVVAGRGAA